MTRGRAVRVVAGLALPVAVAILLGAVAGGAAVHLIRIPRVQELATYQPDIITEIRAEDGTVIARYAIERRILISSDQIPRILKRAIIDTEDKNFYHHGGVDALRIISAAVKDLVLHRYAQGASTLTQQLARAVFLTPQKNFARKINEAFLAIDIERHYSKDQILTLYCNQIYTGHGNYGVESAARYYFGKHARDLDLAQAALLAGLIQRPEEFSPFRRPEAALARRRHVLTRMLDEHDITKAQLAAANAQPLPHSPALRDSTIAPYLCEDIRQYLEKTYGENDLYRRGLRVDSTVDIRLQNWSEEALRWGLRRIEMTHGFRNPENVIPEGFTDPATYVDPSWSQPAPGGTENAVVLAVSRKTATLKVGNRIENLPPAAFAWTGQPRFPGNLRRGDLVVVVHDKDARGKPETLIEPVPRSQGAVLIIDNATGAVRAMVGGYDWGESKFNRAIQALRQTGSSFKPFTYLTALESGWTPADTLLDEPLSIVIDPHQPPYQPHNYDQKFYGAVTLRKALEDSLNVATIRLAQAVGLRNIIDTAHRFGIHEPMLAYPSLAIGSFETTLWEMTSAYSTFANEGLWLAPYTISRVEDSDGNVLEQNRSDPREVAPPQAAFQLVWMLKGVCVRGTGAAAQSLGLSNIAGKTGTTNDYTDAWFIGFTPRYTVGVWTGNDEKKLSLGRGMEGSRAALPIWMRILAHMKEAGYIDPNNKFEVPPNISLELVDYDTGRRATPETPHAILEAFAAGSQPAEEAAAR